MAFPHTISTTDPVNTDTPKNGASEFRNLKQFLVDMFGWSTDPTSLTAAPFDISDAGVVTVLQSPLSLTGIAQYTGQNRWRYKNSMASASNSGSQSLNDSTDTAIALGAEAFDTDSLHDNAVANTHVTVQITGKYFMSCYLEFASNATGLRLMKPRKNGTSVYATIRETAINGDATSLFYSEIVSLAATDYVEIVGYQSSTGALNVTAARLCLAYLGE